MPEARITSKGQITIPKRIRDELGVEPGDSLELPIENGHLKVRPIHRCRVEEFRGLFRVDRARPFEEERLRAWEEMTRRLREDPDPGNA